MDDAELIKLHATLSSDESIAQYLEDSLACEDPLVFLQALVRVAAVRGIKLPPAQSLSGWVAVHSLLHELDCEGLFVRFVADRSRVKVQDQPRLEGRR